jgi:hypothetical protein
VTVLINKDIDNFGGTAQMAGGPETFTVTYIPLTAAASVYTETDYVVPAPVMRANCRREIMITLAQWSITCTPLTRQPVNHD